MDILACLGYDSTLSGVPWASMSLQSNGVLSALNMIAHSEYYPLDREFLASVAFPFSRDALRFYQCWMTRRADGSWVNTKDQSHECNPRGGPVTEQSKEEQCYQNNSVVANGFIRRVAAALPVMAAKLGEPIDPQWAEIRDKMDPLPTATLDTDSGEGEGEADGDGSSSSVFTMAGKYTGVKCGAPVAKLSSGNCGTRSKSCVACGPQSKNAMDVATWHIFPGEATNLASPAGLLATSIASLRNDQPWLQGNSFCSVFSQAARVGMPVGEWLPALQGIIAKQSMANGIVSQNGGGVEVAGALQAIADMMLQSVTPLLRSGGPSSSAVAGNAGNTSASDFFALFPIAGLNHTDMSFHRLRAKGGFVVSARYSKATQQLDGVVTVHAEAGGACRIQLPPAGHYATVTVTEQATGKAVPVIRSSHGSSSSSSRTVAVEFSTHAGRDYVLTAAA